MLRNMAWLTPQRAKLYASGAVITLVLTFIRKILFLYNHGGYDLEGNLLGGDFASFWAASRQILVGQVAEVYVPKLHYLAELPVLRGKYEYFFYPPTYLVLCIPLAFAPFFVSYTLFITTTAITFATVVYNSSKAIWGIVAVLAYCEVYINIIGGQNAFLTAAILGYGLLIVDRRPRLAGAILD